MQIFSAVQLERYADCLIWALKTARRRPFKRGEVVALRYDLDALPLAEKLFARLVRLGLNPVQRANPTCVMEKSFYQHANLRQVRFIAPGDEVLARQLNGSIYLYAPSSLTHLRQTDPGKIAKAALARKPLKDILDKRDAEGLFSWTLCLYPTQSLAEHAGLTLSEYTRQIVKACFLNRRDPVAQWRKTYKQMQAIKKWLNALAIKYLHIVSERIDLKVSPGRQRRWLGLSGHNIPSFELFCSPDWRGTSGIYYADQPSFRNGNHVQGVSLEFKKGKVVDAKAKQGEAFLRHQLAVDKGASRVGEFSLTDKRFSKIDAFMANTLYDENFGGRHGNCHLALGSSYADSYDGDPQKLGPGEKRSLGFNDSALHWDLVNTAPKQVTAHLKGGDRVLIYKNGLFQH